jgi:hypothetical protein
MNNINDLIRTPYPPHIQKKMDEDYQKFLNLGIQQQNGGKKRKTKNKRKKNKKTKKHNRKY